MFGKAAPFVKHTLESYLGQLSCGFCLGAYLWRSWSLKTTATKTMKESKCKNLESRFKCAEKHMHKNDLRISFE